MGEIQRPSEEEEWAAGESCTTPLELKIPEWSLPKVASELATLGFVALPFQGKDFRRSPGGVACLLGGGRNLQQQARTHHSRSTRAKPHLWVAAVPFFYTRLF